MRLGFRLLNWLNFIFNNLLSNAAKDSPDEGIGIAEEDRAKIFESFYRTMQSEIFAGNGLGLTIVKRAVEMHGGENKIESELGKGTKFTVRIPIASV